jgi:hypothetical protein
MIDLYESIPLDEALDKLSSAVRARLVSRGLGEASWEALGVHPTGGKVGVKANDLSVPETYSAIQRMNAWEIVREECDRFLFERYGPDV